MGISSNADLKSGSTLPPTQNRNAGKPLAFLLHSLLGLKLSVLTLLVLATGALATVSHEIDWLTDSRVRASPYNDPVDFAKIWNAVREEYPLSRIESLELTPEELVPWAGLTFASRVTIYSPNGQRSTVFVDPGSGRINGDRGSMDFPRFMRLLHFSLFSYPLGFFLVSLVSFLLIGSMASGLLIFKQFASAFFKLPRRNKDLRIILGGLHRLVSVWSLWFITVISFTGVWYLGEDLLWRTGLPLYGENNSRLTESDLKMLQSITGPLPMKPLLDQAQSSMPDLQIRTIYWEQPPLGAIHFSGQTNALLTRNRASHISLNPYTGKVLIAQRAKDLNAFWRFSHMADPLHFGNFGGLPTKLIWFGFGLALCLLTVSGVWIFLKRTVSTTKQFKPEFQKHPMRLGWLGKWKWINIFVLALPVVAFTADYGLLKTESQWIGLGKKLAASYPIELMVHYPEKSRNVLQTKVELDPAYQQKIKMAYLKPNLPNATSILLEGLNPTSITFPLTTLETESTSFELTVHEWNGAIRRITWP